MHQQFVQLQNYEVLSRISIDYILCSDMSQHQPDQSLHGDWPYRDFVEFGKSL